MQLAFFGGVADAFKIVGGIELGVAEKFPAHAVESVRAGFDRGIENRGSGAAVFGAEVGGLHLEFLNRVHRRQNYKVCAVEEVDSVRVVVNSIQQVVVLRRPRTVGGEGAGGRVAARVCLRRVHSGRQLGQEGEVSAVQGKIIHVARVDHLADRSVLGLEHRSGGRDFYRLRHLARFQREIRHYRRTYVDHDVLLGRGLEAGVGGGDRVAPDPHRRELVVAIRFPLWS